MARRIARIALALAMVAVGVVLVLDLLYFAHGSLEMIPTREDHDKVRSVTGFLGVLLAAVEIGLGWLFRHLGSTAPSPVRPGGH